nr:salivary glue protein Sgs-3-like [Neodiprion pinetum]
MYIHSYCKSPVTITRLAVSTLMKLARASTKLLSVTIHCDVAPRVQVTTNPKPAGKSRTGEPCPVGKDPNITEAPPTLGRAERQIQYDHGRDRIETKNSLGYERKRERKKEREKPPHSHRHTPLHTRRRLQEPTRPNHTPPHLETPTHTRRRHQKHKMENQQTKIPALMTLRLTRPTTTTTQTKKNTTITNTRTGPTPTQIRTRRHTPDGDPTNPTTDTPHIQKGNTDHHDDNTLNNHCTHSHTETLTNTHNDDHTHKYTLRTKAMTNGKTKNSSTK